uniref:Maltose phosphorylase n=1 Tax=Neisseria meningitidis alpha275 TaxID=295996 RepID=C6SHR3_NEIME|nr:maltose phosphorylase [Neisseria meningitidis alpha275]
MHPAKGACYFSEHPPLAAGPKGFSNQQFGGRGIGRFTESRRLRRACRRRYPAKQDLRDKICSNTQGGT